MPDLNIDNRAHRPTRDARLPSGSVLMPPVARRIGRTPLLRLTTVTDGLAPAVTVYAKAEYLNPGGSVKDRPARNMIRHGLETGALTPHKTLIDATSGNTGIAYAMLGAALGIRVCLAMPASASAERIQILRTYGAEIILTDALEGADGAQRYVKARVAEAPGRYFYPDQYNNEMNWRAHYDGTGPEILAQTRGRLTHFVAGLGTSGTFTGVTRFLRRKAPGVRAYALQPDGPLHGMEGLKHMATAIVPGIYDPDLADEHLQIASEEAYAMTRRLAREEGLLVGVSAGANVAAAVRLARTLDEGLVVTILPDTGTRYLSLPFWNEEEDRP